MAKFIIQDNLLDVNQLKQVEEATRDYPREFVGVIPFTDKIHSENPIEGIDYIPYGSTRLIKTAHDLKWKGLYYDPTNFNYDSYLSNRSDMLNMDSCTIGEAIDDCDFYIECEEDREVLSKDNNFIEYYFIRPTKDLKSFSGMTGSPQEIKSFLLDITNTATSKSEKLDLDTRVVFNPVLKISAEWRYFVVNEKIISGSMYKFNGKLTPIKVTDPWMLSIAQKKADKWLPNKNCVMDLCSIGQKIKVLEFNCINASGFYACDVNAIFKALWEDYNNE